MTRLPSLDGAAPLPHLGLVQATGADAANFLHGQLTNDVVLMDTARARLAGYCSPKGRLLASFVVWKAAPDDIRLLCSADVLAATVKRLSMFVMRAKCRLQDATAAFHCLGLAGPSALAWLGEAAPPTVWGRTAHEGADLVRLPDADGVARFLWVAPHETALPPLPAMDPEAWRWGEVHSGIATVEAATADQFVPQMLNYELVGGVDFKKGCYPGQEVVARSQYRGTTKRRTFLLAGGGPAAPGQEIFHSADPGQPAGMVVNVATVAGEAGGTHLLAELKLAAVDGGTLHLGSADGALLAPLPMPYALVAEPD